jgi:hypothetical protein
MAFVYQPVALNYTGHVPGMSSERTGADAMGLTKIEELNLAIGDA